MKQLIKICLLVLLVPVVCFATCPPNCPHLKNLIQNISLSYNAKTSTLHVQADHLSYDWEVDFIRMMTVELNGQNVDTQNYAMQNSTQTFSDDVQLNAQAGDVITVDLYSTQGSSKSLDLTVSNQDVTTNQSDDAADNSQTDNSST